VISTRRFCARPSGLSLPLGRVLGATGCELAAAAGRAFAGTGDATGSQVAGDGVGTALAQPHSCRLRYPCVGVADDLDTRRPARPDEVGGQFIESGATARASGRSGRNRRAYRCPGHTFRTGRPVRPPQHGAAAFRNIFLGGPPRGADAVTVGVPDDLVPRIDRVDAAILVDRMGRQRRQTAPLEAAKPKPSLCSFTFIDILSQIGTKNFCARYVNKQSQVTEPGSVKPRSFRFGQYTDR
jgi:hypothetical protein